jgi:hypothetical protein
VPGSVRRTSHVDIEWVPDGDPVMLRLGAVARDLLTREDGRAVVVSSATVDAGVSRDRRLVSLAVTPSAAGPAASSLLGSPVGSGFRGRATAALADVAGTPLALLLDDLPVAALISGYATLRAAGLAQGDGFAPSAPGVENFMSDLCSGWRSDGLAITSISSGRGMPVQDCPTAPALDADDPLAWHVVGPLPRGAMRRRRRIDVGPSDDAGLLAVDAMFRDTYGELDGTEGVLHEYSVTATFDPETGVLGSVLAVPRVLPLPECPAAAASAELVSGSTVEQLRSVVRRQLVGTVSCTHLNDLLRCLADLGELARSLR